MSDKTAHIRRGSIEEATARLPAVAPWNERMDLPFDIFITSLGFEDRAVAIAAALSRSEPMPKGDRDALAFICCYTTNREDNERNRGAMSSAVSTFCDQPIDLNADAPEEISRVLGERLKAVALGASKVTVVFDISTASGNLILSIMHVLIAFRDKITLRILYAEPAHYFPTRMEFETGEAALIDSACAIGNEESLIEFGVDEVEINELYPGMDGENRPEYVIAVPAFRTTRLVRCLAQLTDQPLAAPDKHVYWILGEPPASDLKWRCDFQKRIVQRAISAMIGFEESDSLVPQLKPENYTTCSTRDYREILRTVIKQADNLLGHNLSVVHMGSKLQAVGIALALNVRSEIAVWYARPTRYNPAKYSEGIGTLWCLDFPDLMEDIANLQKIGQLSITPRIETERTGLPSA